MSSAAPNSLRFSSASLPSSERLEITYNGALAVVRPESASKLLPATDAWQRFRHSLDALGVWDWAADYRAPDILDGHAWMFEVAYDDRKAHVAGVSAYPGIDGAVVERVDGSGYESLCRSLSLTLMGLTKARAPDSFFVPGASDARVPSQSPVRPDPSEENR